MMKRAKRKGGRGCKGAVAESHNTELMAPSLEALRLGESSQPHEVVVISDTNERSETIVISPDIHERSDAFVISSSLDTEKGKKVAVSKGKKTKKITSDFDEDSDLAHVEDVYTFKGDENESEPQFKDRYLGIQPDIDEKMRSTLIDWIISIHDKFALSPETLYFSISLIDRFLVQRPVLRRELQLLGVGALLVASKCKEIQAPEIDDFVYVTDNSYNNQQILKMEKTILQHFERGFEVETQYDCLMRSIKASSSDQEVENMVHYLAELAMVYVDTLRFSPSMWAASAIYTARCSLNKSPLWTKALRSLTGYLKSELKECSKLLFSIHSSAGGSEFRAVLEKYSRP